MVVVDDLAVCDLAFEQLLLAHQRIKGVLLFPLERRERLRHKAGDADGHRGALSLVGIRILIVFFNHALGKERDALNIFIGLGGQSVHEIELDRRLAHVVGNIDRAEQIRLADVLIDRVTQALRACLGRKGEAAGLDGGHLVHQFAREAVKTERRQRQTDVMLGCPCGEAVSQCVDLRIVAD